MKIVIIVIFIKCQEQIQLKMERKSQLSVLSGDQPQLTQNKICFTKFKVTLLSWKAGSGSAFRKTS